MHSLEVLIDLEKRNKKEKKKKNELLLTLFSAITSGIQRCRIGLLKVSCLMVHATVMLYMTCSFLCHLKMATACGRSERHRGNIFDCCLIINECKLWPIVLVFASMFNV